MNSQCRLLLPLLQLLAIVSITPQPICWFEQRLLEPNLALDQSLVVGPLILLLFVCMLVVYLCCISSIIVPILSFRVFQGP